MEKSDFTHISVLYNEVIQYLNPQPNQNFIDCTLGRAGHTLDILKKISPNGRMMVIDLDSEAIEFFKSKVKSQKSKVVVVQDNFRNLKNIYQQYFNGVRVDGILLDLGVSSPQLDDLSRGFSFKGSNLLNMNFDKHGKLRADQLVNNWSENELEKIFREYGEEKFSRQIARNIVKVRAEKKISTTDDLVEIIRQSIPMKFQRTSKIHPATKVFQALRIAVNDELGSLQEVLPVALEVLAPGGKLAVISFHSLEDRIVKQFFAEEAKGCICPPSFPICSCGNKPKLKILTKKPIIASSKEITENPRSRSAKMRVIEKF